MAKPELIARQSRRPSGWLGEIVARVMAFETEPANRLAVEKLAVHPGEAVLEIGCGHGRTLARVAATPDARFDAALAVHVVYFWREPLADLGEIRRVLRPGGRLLLVYRPREEETVASLPASVYALRSIEEIEALLAEAGFIEIHSDERNRGRSRFAHTQARRAGAA